MSLGLIKKMNEEAAKKAERKNLKPYIVKEKDLEKFPPFPFPDFGDYRPKGWELVEEHFVDSSGFGRDDESALSLNQFLNKLQIGHGYAIIEQGQFQVFIGEFARKEQRKAA
jgi:hypothetical protein